MTHKHTLASVPKGWWTTKDVATYLEVSMSHAATLMKRITDARLCYTGQKGTKVWAVPEASLDSFIENDYEPVPEEQKLNMRKAAQTTKAEKPQPKPKRRRPRRNLVAPGRSSGSGSTFGVTLNGAVAERLYAFKATLKGFAKTNEDVVYVLLDEALKQRGF